LYKKENKKYNTKHYMNATPMSKPIEHIYNVHILDSFGNATTNIVFSREDEKDTRPDVIHSDLQIHLDDSIRVVKKKILFELWKTTTRCAYEELYIFGKSRGEEIFIGNEGIPTVNPYTVDIDKPLIKPLKQMVFENRLLLNYDTLDGNDIFVCLAENVIDFFMKSKQEDAGRYAIHTYFPLLIEKQINSPNDLYSKKPGLLKDTRDLLDKNTEQLYRSVQMFYDVYHSTKRNTDYIRQGIQSIHFCIQSKKTIESMSDEPTAMLPLYTLFKMIHAVKSIPFIKFNPGNRHENLYRLYYERITSDGRKIPSLSVKQIHKLSREIGRNNQISLFIHGSHLFVNIEQNGDISIHCVLSKPLIASELDDFLRENINPVITKINSDIHVVGHTFALFKTLTDKSIRIQSIKYVASTHIQRDVQIDKIQCIYSLLTVNRANKSEEPIVRYKRVENYKEMNAETALITELYNEMKYSEMNGIEMIQVLSQRLGLSEDQAREKVINILNGSTAYDGEIIEHPGFPMKIQIAKLDNILEFEIDGIDSIRYIDPIKIYIESIIKITQEITPRSELGTYIREICSHSKKVVDADKSHVDNVVVFGEDATRASTVAKVMQPFVFEEDFDIFQELGISDEKIEEDLSQLDEEIYEKDVNTLFEDLYKNTETVSEKEPVPEPVPNKAEAPTSIMETLSATIPTTSLFGLATEPIKPASPVVEPESEESSDEEEGVFFESDDESESSPQGGAKRPKKNGILPPTISESMLAIVPSYFIGLAGEKVKEKINEKVDNIINGNYEEDINVELDGGAPKLKKNGLNPEVASTEDTQIRPDGLSLNHPNPFLRRMQTREPTLFLTKPQGKKYKSYSSSCQPTSRQPVILTDAEKKRIDKEFPGSYKNAIQYGTDPKNPYWYICPRYWCFLTNTSISEEDVNAGKCGTIIPENADVIPEGAYVYEFKGDEHSDIKGKYIEHHPGFLKEGKHPDGYCLPCCFKNWDKAGQGLRREQCAQQTNAAIAEETEQQPVTKQPPKSSLYVISLDTYPVPPTRWGFAPVPIQLFFNIDYRNAVDKNNSAIVLPNTPTFLRYGVEQYQHQSFLGVFADIYAYRQRQLNIPSVEEFKRILAEQITLDVFVKAHNSGLGSVFRPLSRDSNRLRKPEPEIDAKYKESGFIKRLDIRNPEQNNFLRDTISSYEQFIAFITHPTEKIDHTYLWDIFTSDIPGLNAGGVNLVLLEIMDNDVTDNVQLICPTTSYSKYTYDSQKDTVFVIKHDDVYEPIYLYEFVKNADRTGITSQRTFSEKTIHKNIKQLLVNIQKTSGTYCAPLPSLPRVYEFSEPITLDALVEQLHKKNYIPISQVSNYRNKIIGVLVQIDIHTPDAIAMIPCFPSAPSIRFTRDVPVVSIDDVSVWKDYTTTRDTLTRIYKETNHAIPCLPRVKVMEDEIVVGFLTSTNQFVQIMPPYKDDADDGIPVHRSINPIVADKTITTTRNVDKAREETMKRIRLEKQFYVAFRSTIRALLNNYIYRSNKLEITRIIESQTHLYPQKVEQLKKAIIELVDDKVIFVDIDMDVLMDLHSVSLCSEEVGNNTYCLIKENGVAQLSIPKKNLVSQIDNQEMYFIRISDELIRNNRVRLFMFESEKYLNMSDVDYKVNSDEMIITQTAIHGSTFTEMTPYNTSEYIQHTNYETAMPSISQVYNNEPISIQEQYSVPNRDEQTIECVDSIIEIVGSNARSMWKRSFPKTSREIVYKNTVECSFFLLISILKTHTNIQYSILQIKEKLWDAYSLIIEKNPGFLVKIVGILRRQGKKSLMDPVVKRTITLDTLIFSEDYYISDFDIWIFAQSYKLPVILFSPNGLKGFAFKIEWLKCNGRITDKYYFVRSTIRADKPNSVANYHLIQPVLLLSEMREFYAIISSALQGNAEYAINIRSIESTLENIEFVERPK